MAGRNHGGRFAYLFERFPSFVQTFVYREAVEMVRQGATPWLVSVRRPDDPGELAEPVGAEVFYLPEEKELRAEVDANRAAGQLGWSIHRAIPRRRGEKDSQRMFEAVWLGPRLKEKGIRHVHAHFGGLAARTAWWLRRLYGIGYSFTGHANDIFCDTDFPVSNEHLARDAKFIVTETDFARRWMEERYPFARGKVFRVFNGIDPAGFFPREAAWVVPRILSVGRYVEKKGFDVLIEACGLLRDRGLAFVCEVIGEGPLHDALAAQIERLGLGGCVLLAGPRSQTDVRKALARAQLFVLPCQPDSEGGSDNLPTVIAEAMMTGLPCISTPTAGVPEMITDGQDGLLVPAREPLALAEAAARILRDEALATRLGERAMASARERFSIDRTVGELRELIERHLPPREWLRRVLGT
jgi:colanic acid/amylovoran biosynthesis glycosyltransferase